MRSVSNHFPVSNDGQVSAVIYTASLQQNLALPSFPLGYLEGGPDKLLVLPFSFTHYNSAGVLSVDYGTFDQDAFEAALTAILNSIAAELGLTAAGGWSSAANILVTRTWQFAPTSPTSILAITAQDTMAYTPS